MCNLQRSHSMEALFSRILDGGDQVFYRHEQKGDEDLTEVEKREILSRVFEESKPVFLQRYLKWIQKSDEPLFSGTEGPLVTYFLDKLGRPELSQAQKKNRRYNALEKLKKEGVYFSDEKMRERQPLLYDRMVGRFLSDDERLHLRPTVTATRENGWARLLEQFEESGDVARRRAAASDGEWEGTTKGERDAPDRLLAHVKNAFEMEEEEEDEDEEGEGFGGGDGPVMGELQKEMNGIIKRMDDDKEKREAQEAEEETAMEEDDVPVETLREEFIAMMYERFLDGKDTDFFDYSAVDEDDWAEEMDPIAERDREEAWFDVD